MYIYNIYIYIYIYVFDKSSLKSFNNIYQNKIILETHLLKISWVLYRSFFSVIRISRNTKQRSTQRLIQTY